jgi:hypothetical protein
VYMPNGTVSLNISGCVSDIYVSFLRLAHWSFAGTLVAQLHSAPLQCMHFSEGIFFDRALF